MTIKLAPAADTMTWSALACVGEEARAFDGVTCGGKDLIVTEVNLLWLKLSGPPNHATLTAFSSSRSQHSLEATIRGIRTRGGPASSL